ncbi:SOS response-associated peptidase [Opitutaceae bacterium]|jgi:putative SOS response-associated peptidase YedK|nr:SOS response-associated peptidase [Opitutaceae bacterium]
MCSRFTLNLGDAINLSKRLGIPIDEAMVSGADRYNIAPASDVVAFRQGEATFMRWGLIPHWSKPGQGPSAPLINARSETITEKPSFRTAWKKGQRCAIPMTGFYEWEKQGRERLPWLFKRNDGQPLLFAGLWDSWTDANDDLTIVSCSVITTTPNSMLGRIHDRMPVLLDETTAAEWLDPKIDEPTRLITSFPTERLSETALDTYVNSSRHEGPACLTPRGEAPGSQFDLF